MALCPKCSARLKVVRLGGIGVKSCRQCGGQLVSGRSLTVLERRADPQAAPGGNALADVLARSDSVEPLCCPLCRRPMAKLHFRGYRELHFDRCAGCDVYWLDAGELAAMQHFHHERMHDPEGPDARRVRGQGRFESALALREFGYRKLQEKGEYDAPMGPATGLLPGGAAALLCGIGHWVRALLTEQGEMEHIEEATVQRLQGVVPEPPEPLTFARLSPWLRVLIIIVAIVGAAAAVAIAWWLWRH